MPVAPRGRQLAGALMLVVKVIGEPLDEFSLVVEALLHAQTGRRPVSLPVHLVGEFAKPTKGIEEARLPVIAHVENRATFLARPDREGCSRRCHRHISYRPRRRLASFNTP